MTRCATEPLAVPCESTDMRTAPDAEAPSRMTRPALRVLIATVVAVVFFLFFMPPGRGFLPQWSNEYWLDVSRDPKGQPLVELSDFVGIDPPLPAPGVMRYQLRVHSMGRTNPFYAEWRASHWTISLALNDRGEWIDAMDGPFLPDDSERLALKTFVEEDFIPGSEPMKFWPDVAGKVAIDHAVTYGRESEPDLALRWHMWQKRGRVGSRVAYTLACITAGIWSAIILVPKQTAEAHSTPSS